MDWNGNNIGDAFVYWAKAFILHTKPDDLEQASANIAHQLKALPLAQQETLKKALDGFGKVMFAK